MSSSVDALQLAIVIDVGTIRISMFLLLNLEVLMYGYDDGAKKTMCVHLSLYSSIQSVLREASDTTQRRLVAMGSAAVSGPWWPQPATHPRGF